MKVRLTERRSTVSNTGMALEISIPAQRHIYAVLFLGVWLLGWAFGEVSAVTQIATGRMGGQSLFLGFWLAGWTLGGGYALRSALWMVVGRELLILGTDSLGVKRDVLGFGQTMEYDLPNVKALRTVPPPLTLGSRSFDPTGYSGGTIAFEYGLKTIRVGGGLDEAEAAQIVSELRARHDFQ